MNLIKKFKTPENLTFITTFLIGFATHLFGFVNVIHNYDDINSLPSETGAGLTSGRWLLSILDIIFDKLGMTYNLPYVNAVLFILLISLSSKYIVRTLDIKKTISAILVGAIFVVFPTATSTLFFKFTSVLYGIAILASIMAVWCAKRFKYGFIPSIILIACSLGIYQAYIPITISLMVILLLKENLSKKSKTKDTIKQGTKYVATLAGGTISYYIVLKFFLIIFNRQLKEYQGIDKMGQLEITQLPYLFKRCFSEFFSIIYNDYNGVSQTLIIKIGISILGCISIVLILLILKSNKKNLISIILTAFLCSIFPIAINFIVIMCPTSDIYTLMVYSFALIFAVPFALLENIDSLQFSSKILYITKKYSKKIVIITTAVITLSYAYLANLNYTQLYYATRQTENYISSLVIQVRMTDGFDTEKKWAFIGENFNDPLLYNQWHTAPRYGGNATTNTLINAHSRLNWIPNYFGYNIPLVDEEQLTVLEQNKEVLDMPCFPNDGSIKVIDDIIIIKLENTEADS